MAIDKYTIKKETLKDIGDAIRTKRAIDNYIAVEDFANEILKIQSTEQEPPYDVCTYDEAGNILTGQYVGVAKLPAYHHYQNINLQSIVADESLKEVGDYCFQNDTALSKIDASGLQVIGSYAFNGCTALSEIDLWNVREIGENGLQGCSALVIDDLPELETINPNALSGTQVHSLSVGRCKTIGNYGLSGLTGLQHLDAPQVEYLGEYALNGCGLLKETYFPRVLSISNQRVFNGCAFDRLTFDIISNIPYNSSSSSSVFYGSSIDILDLGREITYIANKVFKSAKKKPRVIILRSEEKVCELQGVTDFALDMTDPENPGMILVPASMVDAYKTATNWVTFADHIFAGEDYQEWDY